MEYCLENAEKKNEKILELFRNEIEKYRNIQFTEELYIKNKDFQFLINTSSETKKGIRRKEMSFYETVLADGIYSLWYNGFESFTPRRLIACITGNENLSFHKEKCIHATEQIDALILKIDLPVVKETINGKTRYSFTEMAMKCTPGAFRFHETALQNKKMCNIPKGILGVMKINADSLSRKKKYDEYKEIINVKHYLLRELGRIFKYSQNHNKYAGRKKPVGYTDSNFLKETSRKIVYTRYDSNASYVFEGKSTKEEKKTGMYPIIGFPYSIDRLNKIVCSIMDNLTKNKFLSGYTVIYHDKRELEKAERMGWDLYSANEEGVPKGMALHK